MKRNVGKGKVLVLRYMGCAVLFGSLMFAATPATKQVDAGGKAKVVGSIVSRSGDLIRVREENSNELIVVAITDTTRIERKRGRFPFPRHTDMDVTAMVPGLTIEAEGVGSAEGQLDASKISFTPDEFAIEVAQEQQALADRTAIRNAQASANEGVAAAAQAQYSAVEAQSASIDADADAKAAAAIAIVSAVALSVVNQRVSDLDDYKNEFEVDVFFARNKAVLDATAKRDLANLADIAKSLDGYMIEIAGYSSNTLSKSRDQQISEERAAAVVRYFTEVKDIPMRRILVPVGYGRSHPAATNRDAKGRALNRRVDIKVLVNKALAPTIENDPKG